MPDKPMGTWKVYLGVLFAAMLILNGCSARAGAGETAVIAPLTDQLGGASLLADLPALVISYNGAGEPSVGSTPLGDLQTLLPPTLLSQLTLDQATIERLVSAGIQHIQISNTPSGLRILVNGQPLPTLVWDADSLDNLLQLLEPIEPAAVASLGSLLDTTTNLGVGVVVQLPVPSHVAAIPLIVAGEGSNAAAAETARQAFLTQRRRHADCADSSPICRRWRLDDTGSIRYRVAGADRHSIWLRAPQSRPSGGRRQSRHQSGDRADRRRWYSHNTGRARAPVPALGRWRDPDHA